jgi:hypothetical protein
MSKIGRCSIILTYNNPVKKQMLPKLTVYLAEFTKPYFGSSEVLEKLDTSYHVLCNKSLKQDKYLKTTCKVW